MSKASGVTSKKIVDGVCGAGETSGRRALSVVVKGCKWRRDASAC